MVTLPRPLMTAREETQLTYLAAGRRVIEVGSAIGGSTIAMALVAAHVVSIDHHRGDPWTGPLPTLAPFLEAIEAAGLQRKVTILLDDWRTTLTLIDPAWPHLIFLDAEHSPEAVTLQLVLCQRFRDVRFAVHDISFPGVEQAVTAWALDHHRPIERVDDLAVL